MYLQNKKQQLFVAFSHTIFVFIAPNLVYLHNLDINKVGSITVLLHLSPLLQISMMLISGVIKAQSKAQKMGEILLNLASAPRG